jgi:hypothetical protein
MDFLLPVLFQDYIEYNERNKYCRTVGNFRGDWNDERSGLTDGKTLQETIHELNVLKDQQMHMQFIISSHIKTQISPTCFGPVDHPQGGISCT